MLFYPIINGSYSDNILDSFSKKQFVLNGVALEIYETNNRKKTEYFELALYSNDGKRYFIRQPISDSLKKIKYRLRPNDDVVLYHSAEYEKNGGQRVIELQSNAEILVSFEDTVREQESKYTVINRIGFAALVIGVLMLVFATYQNKNVEARS